MKKRNRDLSNTISRLNNKLNNAGEATDLLSMEFSDLKNKNLELNRLLSSLKESTNNIKNDNKNLEIENDNLENELKELLITLRATSVKLETA